MRRKDREVADLEGQLAILEQCPVCRVAINDPASGVPYLVPLHFGMAAGPHSLTLYFNCATVGTKLELAHNAPTPVGMMVRCESELTAVDGRKLTFSAVMYDDAGEVGRATHERFIIQNEKFQKKADAKKAAE